MRRSTALIRIRFPHNLVERLDRLAERLSGLEKWRFTAKFSVLMLVMRIKGRFGNQLRSQ